MTSLGSTRAIFWIGVVGLIACAGSTNTPLQRAVASGSLGEVQAALKNGADPNAVASDGRPLIASAIRNARYDVAAVLVAAGGNPNISVDGVDALFVVVATGPKCSTSLLDEMLKAGRSPSSVGIAGEPLMTLGLEFGAEACVTHLIAAGANIRATTDLGETMLHAAAMGSTAARVNELIRAGLDINAKMKKGETPLMLAASRPGEGIEADNIVATLLDHGANPCDVDSEGQGASEGALELVGPRRSPMLTSDF